MTVLLKVTEFPGTFDRGTGSWTEGGPSRLFGHVIPAANRRPATGFVDEAWHLAYGPFGDGMPPGQAVKHLFTAEDQPTPVNLTPVRIFAPANALARFSGNAGAAQAVQIGVGTFEFFLPGGLDRFNYAGSAWRGELPTGQPDPWEYWTTLPDLHPGTQIIMVKTSNNAPLNPGQYGPVFAVYHSLSGGQPPG